MSIVDEIRERVSMRELLDFYGIYPRRSNNNYTCLFHSPDKKPSAGITKDGRFFHCFSCNVTVSIFDVVSKIKGCDFKTAIKVIDADFGLGMVGQLSHKEKLELARQQKERERLKAEREELARYELVVLDKIIQELKIWEKCEKLTHITRGEYRREEWKYEDLYFYSLERQNWLNWLYGAICGFSGKEQCEFDYVYGRDRQELLKKIKNGEILI